MCLLAYASHVNPFHGCTTLVKKPSKLVVSSSCMTKMERQVAEDDAVLESLAYEEII